MEWRDVQKSEWMFLCKNKEFFQCFFFFSALKQKSIKPLRHDKRFLAIPFTFPEEKHVPSRSLVDS